MISGTAIVWALSVIALACLGMIGLVVAFADVLTRGQDAAGKGMMVGCYGVVLFGVAAILGFLAIIFALRCWSEITIPTRIVACLPLLICLCIAGTMFVTEQLRKARAAQRDFEERMQTPVYCGIVDDDTLCWQMYNAMQTHDEVTQTQLYAYPIALSDQRHEWFPRSRLIILGTDVQPPKTERGFDSGNSELILNELLNTQPVCPVLIFGKDAKKVRDFAEKLFARGWSVKEVSSADADWLQTSFMPAFRSLVKEKKRSTTNESQSK